eukprot:4617021-Pleurochrysis_carterae.AAC.1
MPSCARLLASFAAMAVVRVRAGFLLLLLPLTMTYLESVLGYSTPRHPPSLDLFLPPRTGAAAGTTFL